MNYSIDIPYLGLTCKKLHAHFLYVDRHARQNLEKTTNMSTEIEKETKDKDEKERSKEKEVKEKQRACEIKPLKPQKF